MPVRSLHSRVLRWPRPAEVEEALRAWAGREAPRHAGLLRLGWFGSYARGDAGVGSDLDLIAVVEESGKPFERRALDWDLLPLPVPAEILIYTRAEWGKLRQQGGRFIRTIEREARWLPLPQVSPAAPG
ncbi:MAG TPA: nucleotidyltransferase domain-containing protein [Thermoanaerobaculia bacterium]|nr:nucleotidyltransferase domain-containing protein [Thermoanaerobaculia bacterium]